MTDSARHPLKLHLPNNTCKLPEIDTINQNENERHYLCSECISICWIMALPQMQTSDINTGDMNTLVHFSSSKQIWSDTFTQFSFVFLHVSVCICILIQSQSKIFFYSVWRTNLNKVKFIQKTISTQNTFLSLKL